MTRNARKCVQEFLDSDGWSIKAKNLNGAAASFSEQQDGCCPQYEVYSMFRRAHQDGTLIAEKEDGIVVRYRALTEYEREQAEERLRIKSLHQERAQKTKTLKPSSPRLNPPLILLDPDPVLEQDDEVDEYGVPVWEPELVGMS
jgi:hypothetical protein